MNTHHPEILWAQRSKKIFLTVELPDAKNTQVKLEPNGHFTFIAGAKNSKYDIKMQLYGRLNVEESKIIEGHRHTFCIIQKEEKGWWKRLLEKEGKAPPFIKADWNHWIDEDEEEEGEDEMDNFNLNRSMNMTDLPEMDPTEDSDDEDGEVPNLQKAEV